MTTVHMLEYGRACGGLGRACGRDSHRGAIAAGRCGRNRHKGAIAEEQRGRSIHRAIVVAGAERIFAIFDEAEEPEDKKDARNLATPKGEIHFSHVTFGYDSQKPILKDVSFFVPAGTKVAVVGPTGAGKTTIINLLTRFYDVQGGGIELDGGDLRDYRMEDLRKAFRVVLQDTALTQGGSQLSQGERQLMTIARAVLTDAPILILDEATSSVDTVTEQRIRRAMLAITSGRTSFIIAHRLSTIRDSDVILLIEEGRIADQGTHEELMRLDGAYARMYRTQMGLE